jgi:nucleoside-diphosphate-sugar epimerase
VFDKVARIRAVVFASQMRVLITGPTGKVGQALLHAIDDHPIFAGASITALCHRRTVAECARVRVVQGSISDRETIDQAMQDVTHVVHLATCKETPDDVMDVTVKGLFWLLEACRESSSFEQFVLIGGDAGMGHFFYPHPLPVTEEHAHTAYPGCYALSKVLEEVMLEQYQIQYGFPGCCLRAPWIMEKDDFKCSLSFGSDVFGGPLWRDLVGTELADQYQAAGTIPVMLDPNGNPVRRNFVHVDDLVSSIIAAITRPDDAAGETFNIAMDEPVDYAAVADYLAETRGLPSVNIPTTHHSTWLDNTKAKFRLGWRPTVDLPTLIDRAWDFQRAADDPREIHYPG